MLNRNELISKIGNEIINRLITLYGNKVKCVILYGSYARGDNDEYSDMDIMVLFDCSYEEVIGYRKEISKIASRVGLENDILVSIVFRDSYSFKKSYDILPFYQNIIKEGQVLYGSN